MRRLGSLLSLLGLAACAGAYENLDPQQFAQAIGAGDIALVDVRTAQEYAAGHIPNAANIDWESPDFLKAVRATYPAGTQLAIYCRSGRRSAAAASALSKAGYKVKNLSGGILAWQNGGGQVSAYAVEHFVTPVGLPVSITLIKHGTLAISYRGLSIHVDPVGQFGKPTDYAAEFPKADIILVTHEHHDHFDPEAIEALTEEGRTLLVTNGRCADMLGHGTALSNGDSLKLPGDILLKAVPAYNYTEGRTMFHPKGRDNGFVLDLDGFRLYVAGDTEDIPEMASLKDIALAFLPVNQPYTMTVQQCVNAVKAFGPKVLIPYHFSQTDVSALPELLPGVDVRLRDMQ